MQGCWYFLPYYWSTLHDVSYPVISSPSKYCRDWHTGQTSAVLHACIADQGYLYFLAIDSCTFSTRILFRICQTNMPNSLYFPYHYILVNIYNICSDSCVGFGQIACNLPIKFYQDILTLFLGDRALGSGGEVKQDLSGVWCYCHEDSSFWSIISSNGHIFRSFGEILTNHFDWDWQLHFTTRLFFDGFVISFLISPALLN